MQKTVWIIVIAIFAIFFSIFLRSQVPVAITPDEVFAAIDDAIAETGAQVDETEVQQVVNKALSTLEDRQKRRLKYLVSAYFILWLIFILYALRLARTQDQLRQRIEQLETNSGRGQKRQ